MIRVDCEREYKQYFWKKEREEAVRLDYGKGREEVKGPELMEGVQQDQMVV